MAMIASGYSSDKLTHNTRESCISMQEGLGAEVPNRLIYIFPAFTMTINAIQTVLVLRYCEQTNLQ